MHRIHGCRLNGVPGTRTTKVMLWLTPFLFPTVAAHALLAHDCFQAIAWTLLYGTSVLLHGNPALFVPAHPVTVVDKFLGHAITMAAAVSAARLPQDRWTAAVWFAVAYAPTVYYVKLARAPQYDPTRWYPWHSSLHVVSVLGMHALCVALRRSRAHGHRQGVAVVSND
jgi:hypothetical protein